MKIGWENLKRMVKVKEATRYMDDGRTAMYSFKHGWRWTAGGIKYSKRWELEDKDLTRMEVTRGESCKEQGLVWRAI